MKNLKTHHWSMASLLAAALFLSLPQVSTATVFYVNDDATGANTGANWNDAFTDLQEGFAAAINHGDAIWIAAGTYYPSVAVGGEDERFQSFQLKNGVAVYGGFAGGEGSLEERDWVNNVTTISGDLGVPGDNSDNSYHVFYHPDNSNIEPSAVLDGVTISDGNANTAGGDKCRGGGMFNRDASPTINNCCFVDNEATNSSYASGGAMCNYYSEPTVFNCMFVDNLAAQSGGAMANLYSASPSVIDCVFHNNIGGMESSGNGDAGAIYNGNSCSPLFVGCTFTENSCNYNGGAVCNSGETSTAFFINCRFSDNAAGMYGGAMHSKSSAAPTLIQCLLNRNIAIAGNGHGGGMYNFAASPIITNCVFHSNSSGCVGDGIYCYQFADPVITNSILMGQDVLYSSSSSEPIVTFCNVEQSGFENPDDHNISVDPLFADPNSDDFHLLANSPCIDAGNNEALPCDLADLDHDDDTEEEIPFDFFGNLRRIDDCSVEDTGQGTAPLVDMGLHEYGSPASAIPTVGGFMIESYPNPFNPTVHITFSVPRDGRVRLEVFDCRGQLVKTLLNDEKIAGDYHLVWSGRTEQGCHVPSGVYFCVLNGAGTVGCKKMVLIR